MMAPDLRTVVAMLAASALLMGVVMCVGIRARRSGGFLKWNLGLGVLAAGWLLYALREGLPDAAAVAGAEALLLAGFCLQFAALAEFGQLRVRRTVWILPAPILLAVLLLLLRNPAALTAASSVACAIALAGTGTAARRLAGDGAAHRMLVLACDAGALVLIARAAAAVFLPQPVASGVVEPAALVLLFATSSAASIAFLLLHRERAEAGLARLAAYDPLTETFNRLPFMSLAEGQIARARRSGEPCALLLLDVDHLARVNRRYRREAGDRALRDLGAILRNTLRAGDLYGRYDSDEFCLLLPNSTLGAALEVAERLRATVAVQRLGGVSPPLSVSIGVAPCEPERAGALHVAIAIARKALARARKDGGNRVAGAAAVVPGTRRVA